MSAGGVFKVIAADNYRWYNTFYVEELEESSDYDELIEEMYDPYDEVPELEDDLEVKLENYLEDKLEDE